MSSHWLVKDSLWTTSLVALENAAKFPSLTVSALHEPNLGIIGLEWSSQESSGPGMRQWRCSRGACLTALHLAVSSVLQGGGGLLPRMGLNCFISKHDA